MHSTLAFTLALAASAAAQGVTQNIAPPSAPPAGCRTTVSGTFHISYTNITNTPAKRDLEERQTSDALTLTLNNGVLLDQLQRTGYIADNFQFQFDGPAQTGAIYTAGWSVCQNNTLALGGSAIFYKCLSGNFYNLYDRSWAAQCSPIYINTDVPAGAGGAGSSGSSSASAAPTSSRAPSTSSASQIPDGTTSSRPVTPTGYSNGTASPTLPASTTASGTGSAPTTVPTGAAATVAYGFPAIAAGVLGALALL